MAEKSEFVYSVSDLFEKILKEEGLTEFYIGPYQRGYKWDSESYYDQVPQLLMDTYHALCKYKDSESFELAEYYLQYITVLKNNDKRSFEVIDGQQRLTTLAIIYDRIYRKNNELRNIALNKINYSREESNLSLYQKLDEISFGKELDDTQDNKYISGAVECIDKFLSILDEDKIKEYYDFLSNSVKIILNRESEFVSPEEVFVNLNGNSVELTNAYLIKGLFLTHGVYREGLNGTSLNYSEILEQRKINGRIWDEIQNWINSEEINYFLFGKESAKNSKGMEHFLELCLIIFSKKEAERNVDEITEKFKLSFDEKREFINSEGNFRLFNRFNEIIITDHDGLKWMENIIHTYKKLKSIYDSTDTANLLGFVLFRKKSKKKLTVNERLEELKTLVTLSESDINSKLAKEVLDILPDLSTINLKYKMEELVPLLLSLSVFPEGLSTQPRFDYISYDDKNWTFEHISPQNPKSSISLPQYARPTVEEMYEKEIKSEKIEKIQDFLTKLKNKEIDEGDLSDEEIPSLDLNEHELKIREQIRSGEIEDVGEVEFLYSPLTKEELDNIGNMALLSNSVNSSISNNPYIIKRYEILKKLEEGNFIPQHTISVFEKALNIQGKTDTTFSADQLNWDSQDVKAHEEWMKARNKDIRDYLNKLVK